MLIGYQEGQFSNLEEKVYKSYCSCCFDDVTCDVSKRSCDQNKVDFLLVRRVKKSEFFNLNQINCHLMMFYSHNF